MGPHIRGHANTEYVCLDRELSAVKKMMHPRKAANGRIGKERSYDYIVLCRALAYAGTMTPWRSTHFPFFRYSLSACFRYQNVSHGQCFHFTFVLKGAIRARNGNLSVRARVYCAAGSSQLRRLTTLVRWLNDFRISDSPKCFYGDRMCQSFSVMHT